MHFWTVLCVLPAEDVEQALARVAHGFDLQLLPPVGLDLGRVLLGKDLAVCVFAAGQLRGDVCGDAADGTNDDHGREHSIIEESERCAGKRRL